VRFEESAVEEGNPAEPARRRSAPCRGLIQGAEEEGAQEIALDLATLGQRPIDLLAEKVGIGIEPALGLHEIEKEDAGELKQGQRVAVIGGNPFGKGAAHPVECAPEGREETPSHRLGVEGAGDVSRRGDRAAVTPASETFQGTQGERSGPIEAGDQDRARRHAHRNRQDAGFRLERHHTREAPGPLQPPRKVRCYAAGALVGFKREPIQPTARPTTAARLSLAPSAHPSAGSHCSTGSCPAARTSDARSSSRRIPSRSVANGTPCK
jgi:hypothetical protein